MKFSEIIYWLSIAFVLYSYIGYAIVITLAARLFSSKKQSFDVNSELLSVALLVAAHNEEECIADRIQNALDLDYPEDKLTIYIASDGSTDRTNAIVSELASSRVKLLAYEPNQGKSATLNRAITEVLEEVLVFSDANTLYEPDAIKRLVERLHDPTIGVVCGKLLLHDPDGGTNVDGLYWRFENHLKQCEGQLQAVLGANGAIYAMRRALFVAIPNNTIIDDFTIPLLAKIKHRCLITYEPYATAHETTVTHISGEFRRRVRIGAGNYQALSLLWSLIHPRYGWTSFTFFSHKILRWLTPAFLMLAFASNLALLHHTFYQILFVAQLVFYVAAISAHWLPGRSLPVRLARVAAMFCSMNAAVFLGFWRWLLTAQSGTWKRTERGGSIGSTN